MKTLLTRLAVVVLSLHAARAQQAPPLDLPGVVRTFEVNQKGIADAGDLQLAPARERYLATLAGTEAVATKAGKSADLAVIAGERMAVKAANLPADAPPDLPKALATDRRAYTSAAANVARTTGQRQRELTAKFLQALTGLEATARKANDAALAEAIAQEKQRATELLAASGGGAKHTNVIANGDFSQGAEGAPPSGWKNSTEKKVEDATIFAEGGNKFLRFRRLEPQERRTLMPEKEIPVPARARAAEVSFKIRVKGLVPSKEVWARYPGVHVSGRDAAGNDAGKEEFQVKEDGNWKRVTGRLALTDEAKTLKVTIGPHNATGVIDLDDIALEFR